jgi:hypothetical protein
MSYAQVQGLGERYQPCTVIARQLQHKELAWDDKAGHYAACVHLIAASPASATLCALIARLGLYHFLAPKTLHPCWAPAVDAAAAAA